MNVILGKHKMHGRVIVTVRRHPHTIDNLTFAAMIKNGLLGAFTRDVEVKEFDNLVMDVGKNMVRDALRGSVTDAKIKYLGVGTSNTAVSAAQTQLVAENGRKAVTAQVAGGTGVVTTTTYLAPGEFNIAIAELGWFCGTAATGTSNSGIMLARVLYAYTKTNLESIQVDRVDTIS